MNTLFRFHLLQKCLIFRENGKQRKASSYKEKKKKAFVFKKKEKKRWSRMEEYSSEEVYSL